MAEIDPRALDAALAVALDLPVRVKTIYGYEIEVGYSESWQGMGMVIEAMRGKGYTYEVCGYPQHQSIKLYASQREPLPPCRAVFALDREPWIRAEGYADRPEMAVALAVLAAVAPAELARLREGTNG